MNKLVQLPKTAFITCPNWSDLKITNHQATSGNFTYWILGAQNYEYWEEVLPQLISQGFRYNAVVEQIIQDIKNPEKIGEILWYMGIKKSPKKLVKFVSTKSGQETVSEMIKKIHLCKNWKQFHNTFKQESLFMQNFETKIKARFKKCDL